MLNYRFTEKEQQIILNSLQMIVDTREKRNEHILDYFHERGIPFQQKTMKTGDYGAMIPKNPELGFVRDVYLAALIERKNGVDELVESIKDRNRFEQELLRSKPYPFVLLVEEADGYEKIVSGQYRSQYNPKALLGSLKTFEARYHFSTVFLPKHTMGNYIYHHLLYFAREFLK